MSSIGCLSEMAQNCSNVVSALNNGSIPNTKMVDSIVNAASVISGLSQDVANILSVVAK